MAILGGVDQVNSNPSQLAQGRLYEAMHVLLKEKEAFQVPPHPQLSVILWVLVVDRELLSLL